MTLYVTLVSSFPNAIQGVDHNLLKALETCAIVNKASIISYEYLVSPWC